MVIVIKLTDRLTYAIFSWVREFINYGYWLVRSLLLQD